MMELHLNTFLPYRLAVLAARVSADFSKTYARKYDLSVPEWRVLAHLSQEGAVSVREIHKRVDMDKPKVSRAAARLELRGLVQKAENPNDKRLVSLSLTKKGRSMVSEMTPLALSFQDEMLARLTNAEQQALYRAIEIFTEDAK